MRCDFAPRNLLAGCFAVVLVTVLWVPLCYAPQREKPEKLNIDTVTWGSSSYDFHVELSALFGIAAAAEDAGFTLQTLLLIADAESGELIDLLMQADPIDNTKGVLPGRDGFTPLAPQLIAWDDTFEGPVFVMALCEVLNPAGETVTSASAIATILVVRGSE